MPISYPPQVVTNVFNNQNSKRSVKIWTGQATTTSGVATFYPTDNNNSNGNAFFTNIYTTIATAETNTGTATSVPQASVKAIGADKKSVTVNAVDGTILGALGATSVFAPDGTNVHLTIIGD